MQTHLTLTQLEGDDWGPPQDDSVLVKECHRLRHVPLSDLTVENLRILIGQEISLPFTVPLALEHLSKDPMVSGDLYPGDLLEAVQRLTDDFWAQHPSLVTVWEKVRAHASLDSSPARRMPIRVARPQSDEDWQHARQLIEEYAASLKVDLSFQNLAHELEHLTSEYGPPTGAFLLAVEEGAHVGCVGLRQFSKGIGEVKRLYVRPAARGRGVGRLLAEAILRAAKPLGYGRLVLDTLPSMMEAQSMYVSLGFKPTAPYRFNPVPGTAFLELDLR